MGKQSLKKRPAQKRLTNAEKKERADFAERENRTREMLKDKIGRANALRSKEREFHGLNREFLFYQEDMLRLYERAKDSKHARDIGLAREEIVRNFLVDTGLLPARYAVSDRSVRVASTTGHVSRELDILFYDPFDSVSLMRRENAFQVLPVESTYGTIQVKSKLTRQEIRDGLENIASYKRLRRTKTEGWTVFSGRPKSQQGFGILFAFDTDLDWIDLVNEIEAFAQEKPKHLWCNAVFVLTKGFVLHGTEHRAVYLNDDISTINELQMHGRPDRTGHCLYDLYSVLLDLLKNTNVQPPPVQSYFQLPLVAGDHSYKYSHGYFAEFGTCETHGDFPRKLTEEKLVEVIEWCKSAEPINWIRATDIAYGKAGDNTEAYERQPGDVRIYNPDALPFSDILVMDRPFIRDGEQVNIAALAFDSIETNDMIIWIPYVYEVTRGIINSCPKCEQKKPQRSATVITA